MLQYIRSVRMCVSVFYVDEPGCDSMAELTKYAIREGLLTLE